MPFRTFVRPGVLTSEDLNFLQGVYEAATADVSSVDDAAMHDIVHMLIRCYQSGQRDRHWLIQYCKGELQRAVG